MITETRAQLVSVTDRCSRLNTIVRVSDGRVGTICYHNLEGVGGVWGRHKFEMPASGFGDLPKPEFLLRALDREIIEGVENAGVEGVEVLEVGNGC